MKIRSNMFLIVELPSFFSLFTRNAPIDDKERSNYKYNLQIIHEKYIICSKEESKLRRGEIKSSNGALIFEMQTI